jgi:RNA processing factor Prp31
MMRKKCYANSLSIAAWFLFPVFVVDMVNIVNFTQRMVKLAEFRKNLSTYLSDKMNIVAPNLSALIGDTVGARLISKVRY